MKKYNLIILAGGEDEDWCSHYGYNRKAFLPLGGKPMLSLVIDAFRNSPYINKIIVVGSKELEQLDAMRHVDKRINEGKNFVHSLLNAVIYTKASLYKFANDHDGYLISFCDAAYLNADIVNATLANMAKDEDSTLILHYIAAKTISQFGFPIENRTYLQLDGKPYTGSNIYYVKQFRAILRVLKELGALRKYRKNPQKFLEHIGCDNKTIPEISAIVSDYIKAPAKIYISPYAQMGVDIDKREDYELAKLHFSKLQNQDDLSFEEMDASDETNNERANS